MKLIALMPVRNEAWILGLSARVALMWCDALIVLDHASTDGTRAILCDLAAEFGHERIVWFSDEDAEWKEMAHRQFLLAAGRAAAGSHFAIVDADEILCADSLPHIRHWAKSLMPAECLQVRMHSMWRNPYIYRVDPASVWSNRRDLSLVFRDSPSLGWSPDRAGYQHHARAPRGTLAVASSVRGHLTRNQIATRNPDVGVMHMQWASWRRVTAKHAFYKVHERLTNASASVRRIDQMYNQALNEYGLVTLPAPPEWWTAYGDLLQYLDVEAEPWQEAEVKRLVAQRGLGTFKGLDLFGVA
jgi:hypothetical protein